MKPKIMITGAAGFIGHHLAIRLSQDYEIVAVDNLVRGVPERLKAPNNKIIFEQCDVTNLQSVETIFDRHEVAACFHLAAINGTGNFYKIPVEIMDVGVLGCLNVLRCAKKFKVPKTILASSAEVYQDPPIIPTPEDVPLKIPEVKNPRYSYGLSKIFTEYYSYQFAKKHDLSVSIFRPHNVYGPDMGLQHVIPQIITQFIEQADSPVVKVITKGAIEAKRAFCYVSDIIDALQLLLNESKGVEVYNIGSSNMISIESVIATIGEVYGKKFDIVSSIDEHDGGTLVRCPDISKVSALGYNPSVCFQDGVARTARWYSDNYEPQHVRDNVLL